VRKKTFRYRLYPSAAQERVLLSTLEECRWLYNQLLEERRQTHTESGKERLYVLAAQPLAQAEVRSGLFEERALSSVAECGA
jgi:hypothetical protein